MMTVLLGEVQDLESAKEDQIIKEREFDRLPLPSCVGLERSMNVTRKNSESR